MNTAVLTATEFKATCLELFDRLAAREVDRVEVTKRGKVVAVLSPPECPAASLEAQLKALGASVTIPEDADLTEPAFVGDIHAEAGVLHL